MDSLEASLLQRFKQKDAERTNCQTTLSLHENMSASERSLHQSTFLPQERWDLSLPSTQNKSAQWIERLVCWVKPVMKWNLPHIMNCINELQWLTGQRHCRKKRQTNEYNPPVPKPPHLFCQTLMNCPWGRKRTNWHCRGTTQVVLYHSQPSICRCGIN